MSYTQEQATKIDKRIGGFLETSFVDWDGKITSVIFLRGCNFRCPFCHAGELVESPDEGSDMGAAGPQYALESILSYVRGYRGWVDGVVITGGEPTIYRDLPDMIQRIKDIHTSVKLDTNGSIPDVLQACLPLLDAVSMDVKGPLEKYDALAGCKVDKEKIRASIQMLTEWEGEVEFRTTVAPRYLQLHEDPEEDDICKVARELIAGTSKYVLQQCVPERALDPDFCDAEPYSMEQLRAAAERASAFVQRCLVRQDA